MSELGMTKEKVAEILKKSGIEIIENTDPMYNFWPDYSRAKKVIFQGKWLKDSSEYDQIIRWITDYLKI